MHSESAPDAANAATRRKDRPGTARLRAVIAIIFGLFYAYDLFEAIANAFGVTAQIAARNETAASFGVDPIAVPWVVLVVDLLVPPVVYAAAYFLGRGLRLPQQALVFLVGLTLVAALTLSLTGFVAG